MLHTIERGSGQLVVLLHSGGMSSRQWRPLLELASAARRVVAVDLLGSGASPLLPDDAPFDLSVEVDAVLAALPTTAPLHLVGHSYGAVLALRLAALRPELTLSLALYEPPVFGLVHAAGDEDALASLRTLEADPAFSDDVTGGSAAWLRVFVDFWSGAGAWDGLAPQGREAFVRTGRKVFREVRALMADRTPPAAYRAITAPTLLLSGARSPRAEQRAMQLLAAALPNATSVVLPTAGHMGPITHADEVNAAILEHLADAERANAVRPSGAPI